MKRTIFYLAICLFGYINICNSQTNIKDINTDHINLHTNRDIYNTGETIYFKGYINSSLGDSLQSSNLFTELWDSAFHLIAHTVAPVIYGTAAAALTIPASVNNGPLLLRAYTDKSPYQFIKPVFINATPASFCSSFPVFYPEGGSMVYGADNKIIFKAPPGFYSVIKNNKGDSVTAIQTEGHGYGSFSITPLPGSSYTCYFKDSMGNRATTPLPVPVSGGVALHVQQVGDKLYYVVNKGANASLAKIKLQALVEGRAVYSADIDLSSKNIISSFIPVASLPPSIAAIVIADGNGQAIAKRPVFINVIKTGIAIPEINFTEKNLSKRGENRIEISFADSMHDVSVSIADAAFYNTDITHRLINSYAGLMQYAGGLFADTANSSEKAAFLDRLLISNAAHIDFEVPHNTTTDTGYYLQVKGTMVDNRKPYAEKELLVSIEPKDEALQLYKVITGKQGEFMLKGLVFYDTAAIKSVALNENNIPPEGSFSVSMAHPQDSAGLLNRFMQYGKLILNRYKGVQAPAQDLQLQPGTLVFEENNVMLKNVTVKNNPNLIERRRLDALEKKHESGPLSAYKATSYSVNVLDDDMAESYFDVYNYISARIPQLTVITINDKKELIELRYKFRRSGPIKDYYIDGSKTEKSVVDQLSIKDIALIKYIPQYGGLPDLPPVVSIYLKKQGEMGQWEKEKYKAELNDIVGYPLSKTFITPDYAKVDTKITGDYRKTLLWEPYVPVMNGKAVLAFYNNDFTHKIRLIIQGITDDGRYLYVEKLVE